MPDPIYTGVIVTDQIAYLDKKATEAYNTTMDIILRLESVGAEILGVAVNTEVDNIEPPTIDVEWPTEPIAPVFPDLPDPTLTIDYSEDPFLNDLFTELQSILITDLESRGTGIDPGVQQAMWEMEGERDLLALQDAREQVFADWSEFGWSLPDGFLMAQETSIIKDWENRRLDKSRKIAEDTFKIAIDQNRFNKEQSNTLVKNIMDYTGGSWDRKLRAALGFLDTGIRYFEALVKKVTALADIYKAESEVLTAQVDARAKIATVTYELFDTRAKFILGKADVQLREIGFEIDKMKAFLQINTEGMNSAASISSHMVAGAWSSINIGARQDFNGNENHNVSESQSTSNNTNMNFNYQYDSGL